MARDDERNPNILHKANSHDAYLQRKENISSNCWNQEALIILSLDRLIKHNQLLPK